MWVEVLKGEVAQSCTRRGDKRSTNKSFRTVGDDQRSTVRHLVSSPMMGKRSFTKMFFGMCSTRRGVETDGQERGVS